MTKARKPRAVWALQLGMPGREFIASAKWPVLAVFETRKAAVAWIKENHYDNRRIWPGATIVRLEVAPARKKVREK